ncbi:MAG TPA: N-acetylmuramoyl-L-alanine amidase [Desulfobacteria bacterium]|nr:N-acetylmuramoyl-L-alanine amidase [Desulfobacteria bacterium]
MPKGCSNPGHGGYDSGALGRKSLEKDLNLRFSLKFAKRMRDQGFEMLETRTTDKFVSLREIAGIANNSRVDFFQSIHCNAGGGHGFEIYVLPGGRAEKWARVLEKHLTRALGITDRGVKTNQNFYVLVNTDMPALLVELAFLDNPGEEAKLLDPYWQDNAVEAMTQAWCEIYGLAYRPPAAAAKQVLIKQVPVKQVPVKEAEQQKPAVQQAAPLQAKAALLNETLAQLAKLGELIRKLAE